MRSVVTLVTNPHTPGLDKRLVDLAAAALADSGTPPTPAEWLAPGVACDLPLADAEPAAAERAVRAALGAAPVDIAGQPQLGRRKRLLVADMDSTVVAAETLDELADIAGIRDRVAPITAQAMNGEIDFAEALRRRVAMLAGLPESALAAALARLRPMPGARTLVRTMRAHGAGAALVSGGFRWFTERIAATVGFDCHEANELIVADGRLTGRVAEPILGSAAKLAALTRLAAERGLGLAETLAVGDGANDLPMLGAAGLGVAFRARPAVAAAARWRVDHGDLTALLYLQGYRASEFRD